MPSVLKIEYDPYSEFCTLIHGYNKRFIEFVKMGIKPTSYRRYDVGTKQWFVHISKLDKVIAAGKKYFEHVDYRSLPDDLQIKVVKKLEFWNNNNEYTGKFDLPYAGLSNKRISPCDILYVKESAPWEVIKAAYKALVMLYHPDHGGNEESFREIQAAYEELKTKVGN